jgi:hypothetical protein
MKSTSLFCGLMLAVAGLLFAAGCATQPKVDWNARVGNYTFDQAVVDMGPPDRQSELSDGRKVVEWVTGYSGGGGLSIGIGGFSRHTGVGVSHSVGSGGYERVLRLTFGADGRLTEWRRN